MKKQNQTKPSIKPKKSDTEHSFAQKYKLDLTPKQATTFLKWGGSVRLLQNAAKEEREIRHQQNKNRPENLRENINSYSQSYSLPEIKSMVGFEFFNEIPSQVLQQSLMDVNTSFQNFFKGESKYPKWKSRTKNGIQLRFPDGKNVRIKKLNRNNSKVTLPKIGSVRFKTGGRKIPSSARIRSCTITGNSMGTEFYISFNLGMNSTEFQKTIPKNNGEAVGGDRGIKIAMQLSNGKNWIFPLEKVREINQKLKKAQRKLAKKKKPTKQNPEHKAILYKAQQEKIRRLHIKIKNIRLDFNHKLTTQIAKNHGLVVLEDLRLKNITKSAKGTIDKPGRKVRQKSGLNRELLNIGIGMQSEMLLYKCKWYDSHLVLVNPKNSSRECSKCGHTSKENRKSQSVFKCISCDHTENADLNAAKVILARGHRVLACGEDVPVTAFVVAKNSSKNLRSRKEARTSEKFVALR